MTPQYIAGLIDGEGYLGLLPSKVKGLVVQSFEPVIKIGMTDDAFTVLETIRALYDGTIEKRTAKTKGNRNAYTIVFKGKKRVALLLQDILPYIYVKKAQAILLNQYCQLPSSHTRYKSFNPETVNKKIFIYHEMKRLKQPVATTN